MSHIRNLWGDNNKTVTKINASCCGCSACSNVCSVGAIQMSYDDEGFLYPKVSEMKCIDCGACLRVCPISTDSVTASDYLATYGGYSTNTEIMTNCTSGGFATELAELIIKKGGIVYGVKYDSSYICANYVRVDTEDELKALMGSKYVQAEKGDIHNQVKQDVEEGLLVLFIGCPCDVVALKLFLKKEYKNLCTCELVCMGVTSYRIAEDYKKYTEKKAKSKLTYINARSKSKGWFVPQLEERFENGKTKFSTLFGTYYGYGSQVYNRPSCFECHYRDKNGVADVRVGDFWGIKKSDLFWNPDGVSCIFVRSTQGLKLINELRENGFKLYQTDYDMATMNNMSSRINKPLKYYELREQFAKLYSQHGLVRACKATETFRVKVKRIMPNRVQWVLKRIYHAIRDRRGK